jgi:phage gp16-like protein
MKPDRRNRELARIHIAAQALGMDDDAYREMLSGVAGVSSAAELTADGRKQVLDHLKRCGFQFRRRGQKTTVEGPDRSPLMGKIEAHLADAKRPWEYAHGMARRMFRVDRLEWCSAAQLHKIVAALEYDAGRRKRRG